MEVSQFLIFGVAGRAAHRAGSEAQHGGGGQTIGMSLKGRRKINVSPSFLRFPQIGDRPDRLWDGWEDGKVVASRGGRGRRWIGHLYLKEVQHE